MISYFVYEFETYDGDHRLPRVGVDLMLPSGPVATNVSLHDEGRLLRVNMSPSPSFGELTSESIADYLGNLSYFHNLARTAFLHQRTPMEVVHLPRPCRGALEISTHATLDGTRFLRIVGVVDRHHRCANNNNN